MQRANTHHSLRWLRRIADGATELPIPEHVRQSRGELSDNDVECLDSSVLSFELGVGAGVVVHGGIPPALPDLIDDGAWRALSGQPGTRRRWICFRQTSHLHARTLP